MFGARSSRDRIPPGTPPIPAPTVTGAVDRAVQAGATLVATLVATTYNGAAASWSVDAAPAAMTYALDGNAITLTWITDQDDLRDAPYPVALSVSDGARVTSISFEVAVKAAAGALLTLVEAPLPALVDLSDGTHADWTYYGVDAAGDVARKDIETAIIGALAWNLGAVPGRDTYAARAPFAWDDGAAPFAARTDIKSGPHKRAVGVAGHGFTVPIAALSDSVREAWLFFGGLTSNASETSATTLELSLALDGARPIVARHTFGPNRGLEDRLFKVQFRAAAGAVDPELTVAWTNISATGGVQLRAILVDADIAGLSLSAPVTVNVHELYTGTATYTGAAATLTAHDLPIGASFVDHGDNTATLTYRPPLGANNESLSPIVIEAVRDGAVVAVYEAGVSVSAKTADPPVITATSPWSVVIGQPNELAVSAAGAAGIVLEVRALHDDAVFSVPAGKVYWHPTSEDLAGSPYRFTVVATDGAGRQSTKEITANVVSGAGALAFGAATVVNPATETPMAPNLATLGTFGWAHIARNNPGLVVNRKSGGPAITAAVAVLANWTTNVNTQIAACTWTGGTPTASATGLVEGIRTAIEGEELTISVPVGVGAKTLQLYTGHFQGTALVTIAISDGGAIAQTRTLGAVTDGTRQVMTPISLTGIASGAVLTVTIRKTSAGGVFSVTALTVA